MSGTGRDPEKDKSVFEQMGDMEAPPQKIEWRAKLMVGLSFIGALLQLIRKK